MANKHYPINEEIEITLNLKVKITELSTYFPLKEDEIQYEVELAKKELHNCIMHKITGRDYNHETLTDIADYWSFEIHENIEK